MLLLGWEGIKSLSEPGLVRINGLLGLNAIHKNSEYIQVTHFVKKGSKYFISEILYDI
jgi:hypothetical protein